MTKPSFLYFKGSWKEVLDDCRNTVAKEPSAKDPSIKFRKSILIAEHSPIRDIVIRWHWDNIKSWVCTHFARHKFEKFIQTQRTDRTGVNRDELPQGSEVMMTCEANTQQMIDMMRKRLCYQAAPETRKYAEDLKAAITEQDQQIGDVLVPNCVYRCGCPEMTPCGFWKKFKEWCLTHDVGIDVDKDVGHMSIEKRYAFYNVYVESCRQNVDN